jgi:hypothetical protein
VTDNGYEVMTLSAGSPATPVLAWFMHVSS